MVGRQVNTPLLALMAALVGAVSRLKVKVCGGMSASLAELVTTSCYVQQNGLIGDRGATIGALLTLTLLKPAVQLVVLLCAVTANPASALAPIGMIVLAPICVQLLPSEE